MVVTAERPYLEAVLVGDEHVERLLDGGVIF
jgi:hypothetical protein